MKICPECLERMDGDLEYCPEDGTELRTIRAREEDPMEGRVLDEKWVIESKIGGGGMGAVYRAHQLSVDRTVAVKVLRSDLSEDDEHVQRFFREANVASNVSDPRCVTIYDFGQTEDDHVLYLAMEYLEGESLHDRRESHSFTLRETAEIGIEIAAALESLHGQGIIHRDLKPENVYLVDDVGEDLFLKVLDFGLAKVAKSDATPVTASGQVFGTPEFMSPEQCMGSEVGPRSDVYSLGCLLYELVTGQTPFAANASVEVLLAHVNRPPPPVDEGDALPRGYADLIMQMLEKDPADRPESSVAVRERLEAIRDRLSDASEEGIPAPELVEVPDHSLEEDRETAAAPEEELPVGATAAEPEAPPEPADETREGSPRRGTVAVAIAAGLVGLGVAGYFGGLFGGENEAGAKSIGAQQRPAEPEAVRGAVERALDSRAEARIRAASRAAGFYRAERAGDRATFLAGATTFRSAESEEGAERASGEEAATDGQRGAASAADADRETERAGAESGAIESDGSEESGASEEGVVPFLTETNATRIFRSKEGQVENCVVEKAPGDLSSELTIRVEVVVSGEGDVVSTDIPQASSDSQALHTCVEQIAGGLEFPPTKNGSGMRLIHQYHYRPRNAK